LRSFGPLTRNGIAVALRYNRTTAPRRSNVNRTPQFMQRIGRGGLRRSATARRRSVFVVLIPGVIGMDAIRLSLSRRREKLS
jgi:hypothetical protein